ncbi:MULTISPECIES: hypothetical protein [Jeotgalibacillus]|uniref:Uncharacterized protein n=1 Tax=Jeotgalibacillus alimentarius TaxID=135826 RepID=A0A0C2VBW1_9BACL|nr:hypothetical protein [Jeotgalibacillus alimentarius]KIL46432.1 hypothetical protein KP77_25590 [Jeotgalibacillus alimentarius]
MSKHKIMKMSEATAKYSKDGQQEYIPLIGKMYDIDGELHCEVLEYRDFDGNKMPDDGSENELLIN